MKRPSLKSEIEGVVFFDLDFHNDERGWLCELFRSDCLKEANLPEMGYVSLTKPGVSRGPHEHKEQSDLFCFIGPGEFELILWEDRNVSMTSGFYHEERFVVGASKPVAVIVPPGVIHAYKNISDKEGIVFNFPNALFGGPGKFYSVDEIRHEDGSSPFVI